MKKKSKIEDIPEKLTEEKSFYCSLDMLENCSSNRISGDKTSEYIYILKFKNKRYLVKRIGKCDYKKCKNACCKFCHVNNGNDNSTYWENFGIKTNYGVMFKENCNQLNIKSGICKLWDKNLPGACKQFPHPDDSTYWMVYNKCTFKFKILYKLNKIKKDI